MTSLDPHAAVQGLLLAARQQADAGQRGAVRGHSGLAGALSETTVTAALAGPDRDVLTLFGPIAAARGGAGLVVAHLGQSLDGRIATESGDSHYVGGPESLTHLHRLRSLCDAVIVGRGTVEADDPRLTVRHVSGPQPVRVVLDPQGRLGAGYRVFDSGLTDTASWWVTGDRVERPESLPGSVRHARLSLGADGQLAPGDVLAGLASAGLRRILVEGGGRTVSAFLAAGRLDRLELALAPMVIGSGRPSLTLAPVRRLAEAVRPPVRYVPLGDDMLCVLDLAAVQ